jgi:hypothetical protein
MSSLSSPDDSALVSLFRLPPEAYRIMFHQIPTIYQSDPINFANVFFDNLPIMDPKTVRIICYQLYSVNITLDKVYEERTNNTPSFLSELDKFPLETIMTLLKYRFPAYPNGDIFFFSSLERQPSITYIPFSSNLDWLNYILDVCIHQQINLNHINKSTGSTCLHTAIRLGLLSLVQKLLAHKVDPNYKSDKGTTPLFAAIESLGLPASELTYQVSLNIIRHLRRYGATVDNVSKIQIQLSNYESKINQELINGSQMIPEYSSDHDFYFSLDPTEDLSLLAELDPSIIDDANFQKKINKGLPAFKEAIQRKRTKTIITNGEVITWPYYINDTLLVNNQHCYLSIDQRATTALPPDSDEVYRLALKNLPDIGTPTIIDFPTETPAAMVGEVFGSFRGTPPTEYIESPPTFPLTSGPLLPTGTPNLPSI